MKATVSDLMTRAPATVRDGATLSAASATMDEAGVSALPVLDDHGHAIGVISRSDLLRTAVQARPETTRHALLSMPDTFVRSAMHRELVTVSPSTSVVEAAQLMVDRHIHRVFVESARELVGVLSATDLVRCVARRRLETPLGSLMHSPVAAIPTDTPLSVALAELGSHGVDALLVTEHDEAVGLFTQADAIAARALGDDVPVEDAMSRRYIAELAATPVHRAA
ncbi:MAG: CBS domain-containing protein, partial [Sandaracinaceae bacterium]